MKKIIYITLIIAILMQTSCVVTRSTTKINKVETGMSKSEITKLLGTPMFKNGDTTGEQWGYRKTIGEIAGPEQVIFLVTFDTQGRVVGYETVKDHPHYHY